MSGRLMAAASLLALVGAACESPMAPRNLVRQSDALSAQGYAASALRLPAAATFSAQAPDGQDGSCSFDRGTTTCVTTEQYTEKGSHVEYSGCLAGPPPDFRPGSRARTFEDMWQVTVTTTTLYRGRSDHAYDSSSNTSRVLLSSTLVSDVCSPI
jgi:hypothetical protein